MNVFTSPRVLATLVAVAISVLGVAGCSSSSDNNPAAPSSAAAQDRNDADIRFAQGMIPHHQQAIEMAQLASTRANSPQVQDLAKRIRAAQDPEIKSMTGWLAQWGAPPSVAGGMDHGSMGHSSSGMMSPEQMSQLSQTSGAAFDRLFLHMMIEHHNGAVAASNTELREGHNAAAKQLAQSIITGQQAEITEMQAQLQQAAPPAPTTAGGPAPAQPGHGSH